MSFYIIDDNPIMRYAIATLLHRIKPLITVIELEKVDDLASFSLEDHNPELFVLSFLQPCMEDAETIRETKNKFPNTPLVVFSAINSGEAKTLCIEAGADLLFDKLMTVKEIYTSLNFLLKANTSEKSTASMDLMQLSGRQRQLITLLDHGMSNRGIADQLNISEQTVKVHLWRLFRRLNVKSRTQVLYFARTNGLL